MSEIIYSSNSSGGSYSVTWDKTIWYGDPPVDNNKSWDIFMYKPEPASKLDIERLEKEIRDLRKVLTELLTILGGVVKNEK
jgi:hypothetical protein